jgi:hypothetical protein
VEEMACRYGKYLQFIELVVGSRQGFGPPTRDFCVGLIIPFRKKAITQGKKL